MRFNGKLSKEDLDEVRRLIRPRMYWPKLIVSNLYGFLLLGAIAWATVNALIGKTHPSWTTLGLIWVVILAIVGWNFYRTKKSVSKEFLQFNAGLPDWLTLDDKGLTADGPDGALIFRPWLNFKGWRDGRRVILLDLEGDGFIILPIAERSEAERHSILQLVGSHIHVQERAAASR